MEAASITVVKHHGCSIGELSIHSIEISFKSASARRGLSDEES